MTTPPTSAKQRPVHVEPIGTVSASIWLNTTADGRTFYSTTIKRTCRDGDELKNADSFNHDDLLNLAKVDQRAHLNRKLRFGEGGTVAPRT